jgi:hypothetical protein
MVAQGRVRGDGATAVRSGETPARFRHAHNKKTNPETLDIDQIGQRTHGHEEIGLELLGGNGGRARCHGPFRRNELGRALIR